MSDVRPVVVPVEVTVSGNPKRAIDALGEDIRRASDVPGGPGPSAAASGRADTMTMRGAVQEFAKLEHSAQRLVGQFDRLVQVVAQLNMIHVAQLNMGSARGGAPAPLAQPLGASGSPSGAGGSPPTGGGRTRDRHDDAPTPNWRTVLGGILSANAVQGAVGAIYGDLRSRAHSDVAYSQESYRAAVAGGYETDIPGAATRIGDQNRSGSASTVESMVSQRMARQLRLVGASRAADESPDLLRKYADKLGGPQAVEAFATNLYRTNRSERDSENLAISAAYSLKQHVSQQELNAQFTSLNMFFRSTQGMHRVSAGEEQGRWREIAYLRGLPGGIGEGDGAQDLVQGVRAASNKGLGFWIRLQGWKERHPGQDPMTNVYASNQFARDHDEKEFTRLQLGDFKKEFKDPGWREHYLRETGAVSAAGAHRLATGSSDVEAQEIDTQVGIDEAAETARAKAAAQTRGGASLESEVAAGRTRNAPTWMGKATTLYNELYAQYPTMVTGGKAAALVGALRWGENIIRGRLGGAAASTTTARGAAARGLSLGGILGPGYGSLALGKDLYDTYTGNDPTNRGDMIAGGIGATVGGALGLAGGPGGVVAGGLTGYGLGKGAWGAMRDMVSGGHADASLPPGVAGGDGWQRTQVEEQLELMRELVGRGMPPMTARSMGIATQGGAAHAMAHKVQAGEISPDDPRIVAAAERYGIPLRMAQRLFKAESHFNPNALGPVTRSGERAMGLGQLMPATAAELGVTDPYDVEQNADGSMRYLRQLLDHYGGNKQKALAAYNFGRGNVDKGRPLPRETQNYVADIMELTPQTAARYRDEIAAMQSGGTRAQHRRHEETRTLDQHFGPEGGSGEAPLVVELVPGADFHGFIEPQRMTVPGPQRRRP